ncbi:MAG: VanW family protein [Clostridiales bacterium]|nr:VanW family protein [Clostridiales bacterium]
MGFRRKKHYKIIAALIFAAAFISACHIAAALPNNVNAAGGIDGAITVCFENTSRVFDLAAYKDIDSDIFTYREFADRYRISGGYAEKKDLIERIIRQGWDAEVAFRYVYIGLLRDIDAFLSAKVDIAPRNAQILFSPSGSPKFVIKRELNGRKADRGKLYDDLIKAYCAGSFCSVYVSTYRVYAEENAEDLRAQTYLRARFSTSYETSSVDRKHNVRLAVSKFNGMTVPPGGLVSFNQTVGPRTEARGFRTGKIIINGRLEDGLGGGVCQSSTTLYNAALLADMTILQVSHHSLPVSYVPPSFDAMVNSGWSDMVFRNDSDAAVYIRAYCDDRNVSAEFYGLKMPYKIVREAEVTEIIPHTGYERLADTEGKYAEFVTYKDETHVVTYPKDGLKSRGYLTYYGDGNVIKKLLIRSDTYAPTKGLIVEGQRERPVGVFDPMRVVCGS